MSKINNITIDDNELQMEFNGKELSIPLTQEYVKKLLDKALLECSDDLRNLKFYKMGAKICIYPLLFAIAAFLGAFFANFIAMDLATIMCGGMAGMSLIGYSIFKYAEIKTTERAYNNEYWLEIRDMALNNIKHGQENKKKKVSTKVYDNKKTTTNVNRFYNNLTEEDEITKSGRKL